HRTWRPRANPPLSRNRDRTDATGSPVANPVPGGVSLGLNSQGAFTGLSDRRRGLQLGLGRPGLERSGAGGSDRQWLEWPYCGRVRWAAHPGDEQRRQQRLTLEGGGSDDTGVLRDRGEHVSIRRLQRRHQLLDHADRPEPARAVLEELAFEAADMSGGRGTSPPSSNPAVRPAGRRSRTLAYRCVAGRQGLELRRDHQTRDKFVQAVPPRTEETANEFGFSWRTQAPTASGIWKELQKSCAWLSTLRRQTLPERGYPISSLALPPSVRAWLEHQEARG